MHRRYLESTPKGKDAIGAPRMDSRAGTTALDAQRSILDRADVILAAFDSEHTDLSLLGIMVRTGLPKTTVHRAAHKLVGLDWLELHEGRYSIGTRLLEFAGLSWAHAVLRKAALPTMQRLQACTRETVHLAVSNGRDIIYIEKLPGRAPMADLTRVGTRLPAYCTGLGKAILAFSPPPPDSTWPGSLAAMTPHTIVSPRTMRSELARVHDEGVAYDREEYRLGVECIAAPLLPTNNLCAGAISITAPSHRLPLRRLAPALRGAAADISRGLPAAC
jgi:DNA-binding IclR family transcriptional regulator